MSDWKGPLLKPKDRPGSGFKIPKTPYVAPERDKTWEQVWRWLKPRFDKAGRTKCEFGFIEHKCDQEESVNPLDPCHAKKRRKYSQRDLYVVALGCRNAHNIIDGLKVYKPLGRRVTQAEMEKFVLRAIKENGGLIIP